MALKLPARKVSVPPRNTLAVRPRVQTPARNIDSGGFSADDGFAKARAINEQRQREFDLRKDRPIEFGVKVGEGGEKGVTIVLVDHVRMPNLPYFHYMHRWGFEQGEPKQEVCIQDGPEGCGLCRQLNKKGGYEMVLTCIDTRPYTYQRGPNQGKTIQKSKKPYVVKTSMIPAFERLYKAHKTFRGMVLRVFRDNKKAPAAGSQVEFVRMLTEAELAKYGELSKPLDYKKAYPRLDAKKMAQFYGTDSTMPVGGDDFTSGASTDSLPF